MTRLRKMMLEELQRRNYSQTTVKNYLGTVEDFAKHFRRSPDQLGPEQIRSYQVYLLQERKMASAPSVSEPPLCRSDGEPPGKNRGVNLDSDHH